MLYNRPPGVQRRPAAINIEYSFAIKEELAKKENFTNDGKLTDVQF
jgi:hypothetical protein